MQAIGDTISSGGDAHANTVAYELSCGDVSSRCTVVGVEATEELNRPYRVVLDLVAQDEATDVGELLGRNARFSISRREAAENRVFQGIVSRVVIHDNAETRQTASIEIVPALSALAHTQNTRIFQDLTALEIATTVLAEGLGAYDRCVDTAGVDPSRLTKRDYCVQWCETNLEFVSRLLEEEGIGYRFVDDPHGYETLILFDDNHHAPRVQTLVDSGVVRYDASAREWVGGEPVLSFGTTKRVGPTRLSVRDHDWTRARPTVEASAPLAENDATSREHEVYEHGFARHVTIHEDHALLASLLRTFQSAVLPSWFSLGLDFPLELAGGVFESFTSSDIDHQLGIRRDLSGRDATRAHGVSLVTDFTCGKSFTLVGHPTLGSDGDYLLTKVVHTHRPPTFHELDGRPQGHSFSNYHNRFECIPLTTPWRPDRRTRKPRIYGIQTARVTGPLGMDVYTDAHGRIKVKFPWDRSDTDLSGNHTCWLRVSQTWAGHGFPGFVFTPRVGMEVIVSFVEGDPDRPVVTGCLYNGENPTPTLLPVQATKSVIRTRTVPHGPGYNELSFEDAMGMERVHLRAQRNLDELVLRDHTTEVRGGQQNAVGGDQFEHIGRHQRVLVMGDRIQQVEGMMTEHSGNDYLRQVAGFGEEQYGGGYKLLVEHGSATARVEEGSHTTSARGTIALVQNRERAITLSSEGATKGVLLASKGSTIHISDDKIELRVGSSSIVITDGSVQVNRKTFPP